MIPFIPIKSWKAVSKGPAILPGSISWNLNIKGETDPKTAAVMPDIY